MGLKSDGIDASPLGSILLGSLRASLGYTSVQNEGLLPENSVVLPKIGATVLLDTAERIRPLGTEVSRSPFGTGIKLDAPGSASPVGIYSVKMPVASDAAVLGYFKFKSNTTWSLASRNWCNLSLMTGMYFGLEYGPANTICWASLRGSPGGAGSLVIGGPLSTFNAVRPTQQQFNAFNWLAQPSGTVLEMWIVFSMAGYPPPLSPSHTPILEVWTKRAGVDAVPVCHTLAAPIPISTIGQFPNSASLFPNYRLGPSNTATLYFGNVGGGSDSLEMLDWALFPDYRVAVMEGEAVGNNKLTVRGDSPFSYNCVEGRPFDVSPGRWYPMPDVGYLPPSSDLYYSPLRANPSFVVLNKTLGGGAGFQREEPRLEKLDDGAVIEAFMSAEGVYRSAESYGAGISLDDGVNLFRVITLESATRRTLGLSKTALIGNLAANYFTPAEDTDELIDWRSLKLVRLVVDRVRGRVSLFIDGVRYLDQSLASMPASISPVGGRVAFGHLESSVAKAKMNVAFFNYLTRYVAWEIDEQLLPDAAPAAFTLVSSGVGGEILQPVTPPSTELQIGKSGFGVVGSKRYYKRDLPTFDERHGIQIDFRAKVMAYTDRLGTSFAKNIWVGAGVQVFLGNKKLHLGFFDGGVNGRFIGILPGSGTVADIANQTALGRQFSAPADWMAYNFYRLSYKPNEKIEVWVDNIPSGPVISIPWLNDTDGFDLPQDVTTAAVAFGHFDSDPSSTTAWEFFRYGWGNGYEIAIEPRFEDGLKGYLFGGRSLTQVEFDE